MSKRTDGLLAEVKNYLDITWEDDALDAKLEGILRRGMAYLDRIAGTGLRYRPDSLERGLLFDYVRYVRSGAAQDFAEDFSRELNGLHTDVEVAGHEKSYPDF